MIRNLLNGFRLGFAYFSVGTVIAQAVIVPILFWKSVLTHEKCLRLVAHFQGIDTADLIQKEEELAKANAQEVKLNDLRSPLVVKRKEALNVGLAQVKSPEAEISLNQKQYDTVRAIFAKRLDDLEATKVTEARKTVIETLEVLDPELTKDLILLMIDDVGAKEVGEILAGIPRDRERKIKAEFTTPEEKEVLHKILSAYRSNEVTPASDEGEAL